MCTWGTSVLLELVVPASLSHTGEAHTKVVGIDACIAPLVRALNDAGLLTASSCCGHGKAETSVILADGRVVVVEDQPRATLARGSETPDECARCNSTGHIIAVGHGIPDERCRVCDGSERIPPASPPDLAEVECLDLAEFERRADEVQQAAMRYMRVAAKYDMGRGSVSADDTAESRTLAASRAALRAEVLRLATQPRTP